MPGEIEEHETYITVCTYHPDSGFSTGETLDGLEQIPDDVIVWVDVQTDDEEVLARIANHFNLHELAIEDCLTPGHFPKMEDFGRYIFMLFRGMKPDLSFEPEERHDEPEDPEEYEEQERRFTQKVVVFLSDRFVITHRRQEVTWLDALVRQVSSSPDTVLRLGTDSLAHRIIDVLIDRFLRSLQVFERAIDRMEDLIVKQPDNFDMSDVLELKRKLITLRQIMRDQRAIIARLATEPAFIKEKTQRRYFKDVDDHAVTIINTLDNQIGEVLSLRDAYLAMANVRLGDIMRILAVITTIAVPLNVVVGMYGMNFEFIPLLHNPRGFWVVLSSMIAVSILMVLYFRKKRWI